ncbi:PREDICTED: lipase member H [Papilio xuthus]|uniref:Lipase member H n=1 Tax=Papilio xuthus TaxID=66420 RepID=A0AAJ6Z4K7_PAPXU|nr:PREDICTED: lipase member H [Papilio xuthus]
MKVLPVFVIVGFCFTNIYTDRLDERFRLLYSDAVKCNFDKTLDLQVGETKVYFYDFSKDINIVCKINSGVDCITNTTSLDISRRLIVFVPGYKCFIKRDIEELVRQTYKTIPDIYLIIIDHSAYTYETKEKLRSYERSVLYSFYIGNGLGKFLAGFNRYGYPSKNIHCIGHSLGAHILGYAGERYNVETSENVWRITGLDPAGPCFANASKEEQLRSGNAGFVDVYHCNAGQLGTTNAIGDADIFFNKQGKIQPGCKGLSDEDLAKCYHKACILYWTISVLRSHFYQAVACPSYDAYIAGSCTTNTTPIGHLTVAVKGIFYVTTESKHATDQL